MITKPIYTATALAVTIAITGCKPSDDKLELVTPSIEEPIVSQPEPSENVFENDEDTESNSGEVDNKENATDNDSSLNHTQEKVDDMDTSTLTDPEDSVGNAEENINDESKDHDIDGNEDITTDPPLPLNSFTLFSVSAPDVKNDGRELSFEWENPDDTIKDIDFHICVADNTKDLGCHEIGSTKNATKAIISLDRVYPAGSTELFIIAKNGERMSKSNNYPYSFDLQMSHALEGDDNTIRMDFTTIDIIDQMGTYISPSKSVSITPVETAGGTTTAVDLTVETDVYNIPINILPASINDGKETSLLEYVGGRQYPKFIDGYVSIKTYYRESSSSAWKVGEPASFKLIKDQLPIHLDIQGIVKHVHINTHGLYVLATEDDKGTIRTYIQSNEPESSTPEFTLNKEKSNSVILFGSNNSILITSNQPKSNFRTSVDWVDLNLETMVSIPSSVWIDSNSAFMFQHPTKNSTILAQSDIEALNPFDYSITFTSINHSNNQVSQFKIDKEIINDNVKEGMFSNMDVYMTGDGNHIVWNTIWNDDEGHQCNSAYSLLVNLDNETGSLVGEYDILRAGFDSTTTDSCALKGYSWVSPDLKSYTFVHNDKQYVIGKQAFIDKSAITPTKITNR